MKRIAIFASGSGSNAENIATYFADKECIDLVLILSNNPNAFVLDRAKTCAIPSFVFSKKDLNESTIVIDKLKEYNANIVILAGFLLKIPSSLINAYPNRIVNIHPALLPNYGGKGMYGMNVHRAVVADKQKESGISIHYVNEYYDEGNIIFQAKCLLTTDDSPEEVAAKVQELEYTHYPRIIESII